MMILYFYRKKIFSGSLIVISEQQKKKHANLLPNRYKIDNPKHYVDG